MSSQPVKKQHPNQQEENKQDKEMIFCELVKNSPYIQDYVAKRIAVATSPLEDEIVRLNSELEQANAEAEQANAELRKYKLDKTKTEVSRVSDGLIKKSDDQLLQQYKHLKANFDDFSKKLMGGHLLISDTNKSRDLLKFQLISSVADILLKKDESPSLEFEDVIKSLEPAFESFECQINPDVNIRKAFNESLSGLFELSKLFFQEITTREQLDKREDSSIPLEFCLIKADEFNQFNQSDFEVPNSCKNGSNEKISFGIYPSFVLKDLDNETQRTLAKHYVFTSLR